MPESECRRRKHILLADDNTKLCGAIEEFLSHIGFHVITADDGKKALDLYARHREEICFIMTDIFMPIVDGVALIRHIRQSDRDIPMMAMTGATDHALQGALEQLGVPLLSKPFSFHALESHLASVLDPASSDTASRP